MKDEPGQSDTDSYIEPPNRVERIVFWLGLACTLLPVFSVLSLYLSDRLTTVSATRYQYYWSVPVGLALSYGSVMNALRRANLHWYHFAAFTLNLLVCGLISHGYLVAGIMSLVAMFVTIRGEATSRLDYLLPIFFVALVLYMPPIFYTNNRSPVSRVQADMRSLQIAIESYYTDQKTYPVSTTDPTLRAHWKSDSPMPCFMKFRPQGPADLTTPTSYWAAPLPTDPYRLYRDNRTYSYYNHQDKTWILISPGPDCVFNIKPGDLPEIMTKLIDGDSTMLAVNTYDPTNGSFSSGDVYRYRY